MSYAIRTLPPFWFGALAALAVACILAPVALGQDFAVQPGALDPWFALAAQFVFPATMIFGFVLCLRQVAPSVFDPEKPTRWSKTWCLLAALAAGAILAFTGVAPAVGVPGLGGRFAGAFLAACVAVFGRKFWLNAQEGIMGQKPPASTPPATP